MPIDNKGIDSAIVANQEIPFAATVDKLLTIKKNNITPNATSKIDHIGN
jgi:hypothetical protein